MAQDESIFLRTGTNRRKMWSRVGDPVTVNRHGRRDRTVAYGTLAEDGTRLMGSMGGLTPDVRTIPQGGAPQVEQGPPRSGQRKPAQAQGGTEVPGGARRAGDPVPAHRHAEARRSRVRMKGCKVPARHFRTLRNAGGPDACGVRVFQDLLDQA